MSLFISSKGQINIQSHQIDLGVIEQFNNDTIIFLFKNESSKTVYLLSTQPADHYQILVSHKKILPDEELSIGVVLYIEKKGKINYSIPVYFSHLANPIQLNISGNIKSIHPKAIDKCPSIENSEPIKLEQVPLKVIVKDKANLQILGGAKIEVQINNKKNICYQGFNQMSYQCKCDEGLLNVRVELKGYLTQDVNFNYYSDNNVLEVLLEKKVLEIESRDTLPIKQEPIETIVYEPIGKKNNLDELRYMPNHLVFVIDISGSMKDTFKLNYMKSAMIALIKELRPTDYLTLITYAGRAKIVLDYKSGQYKDEIITTIDTLQAKGGSYGADGLVKAYQMANQYFIKNANNQVFLATDGLFNGGNLSNEDLFKMAKKEAQRNQIKLSTIGFGKDEKALLFLKKLSENGNGHYLEIHHLPHDLGVLIEEVKKQSLIQP